jgi:glycine dehydrogenase subunit 1
MAELGETLLARTRYAQQTLAAIPGVELDDDAVHLREFTVTLPIPASDVVSALRAKGIEPGVVVGEYRLLVCVTELTTQADIDTLAAALAEVTASATASATVIEESKCDVLSDDRREESK